MKFHWGHKVTILFVAFAAMMIYMVVRSFQANVDLVSEDYYMQELNYQQQIDKKQNVKEKQRQVTHRLTQEGVELQFAAQSLQTEAKGQINIYRPSEADMDKVLPIALDDQNRQVISPQLLIPGKYILKIDWAEGSTSYYQEIEIKIPGA